MTLKMKPCIVFLVNPFIVEVVNDGCPILEPRFRVSSAVVMELIKLQEDLCLEIIY